MKKSEVILCLILFAGLLCACEGRAEEPVTATSSSTSSVTLSATITEETETSLETVPSPTPVPSPVYVTEKYSVNPEGEILTDVKKIRDGELIYEAEYFRSGNGIQKEIINEYDPDGLLISSVTVLTVKKYDYYTTKGYTVYEYDTDGSLIKEITENCDVDPGTSEETYNSWTLTEYGYDDDGYLISKKTKDYITGALLSSVTYENDGNGNQVRVLSSDGNEYLYEYDFENNVISFVNNAPDHSNKTTYSYSNGLLSYKKEYIDGYLSYEYSYQYDGIGNLSEVTEVSYDRTHKESYTSKYSYEYDDLGRLMKIINSDNPESYEEYVYYIE